MKPAGRATVNILISVPDGWTPDDFENMMTALIGFLHSGKVRTLEAKWACPGIGRNRTPPGPVLVRSVENKWTS